MIIISYFRVRSGSKRSRWNEAGFERAINPIDVLS
jgi:hypothetical protein